MNSVQLKMKLSKLWKDTFHNSDDYISLIFDNYFDPGLAEYEIEEGEIVAGLIGIPYEFGNKESRLKGLLLCGLATKPQSRSQGLMTGMLERINKKAADEGFSFTFLILTADGLRKFFQDRKYVNAFYRVIDNYTSLHDFDLEFDSILAEQKDKVAPLKKRYYDSLKCDYINRIKPADETLLEQITKLICQIEDFQIDLQVIHTPRDIELLVKDNAIRGGKIYYALNSNNEVSAVAFTTISEYGVNVHKLYSSDIASKYRVLSTIKKTEPDLPIRHFVSSIEMDRAALWSRTYGSFMQEAPQVDTVSITERVYSLAAHARVYGMARILNLVEILKFQASLRHDLKYSILMKSSEKGYIEQINTRDGVVKIKKISIEDIDPSKIAYVMSEHDISKILFRRRDTDNLITEAFGIPSINASMCLMFD